LESAEPIITLPGNKRLKKGLLLAASKRRARDNSRSNVFLSKECKGFY
jgi:hypothetical protein